MPCARLAGARDDLDRRVVLLDRAEAGAALRTALPAALRVVAYRSENRIVNRGCDAWTPQGGTPSVWMLGMFPPTPSTTVFLPYDPSSGGKVVDSDCFGALSEDRLSVKDGIVYLRIDGAFRSKVGLPCGRGCSTRLSGHGSRPACKQSSMHLNLKTINPVC